MSESPGASSRHPEPSPRHLKPPHVMLPKLLWGVTTWLVREVILYEILGAEVVRIQNKQSRFELLESGT